MAISNLALLRRWPDVRRADTRERRPRRRWIAGALVAANSADRQRPGTVAHRRSRHAGHRCHRRTPASAQPEGNQSRRLADPRRQGADHRYHAAAPDRCDRGRHCRTGARRLGAVARATPGLALAASDRSEEPGRTDHREVQYHRAAGGCRADGRYRHSGAGAPRWRASRRVGDRTRSRSGRVRSVGEPPGDEAERARAAGIDPGEAGCDHGLPCRSADPGPTECDPIRPARRAAARGIGAGCDVGAERIGSGPGGAERASQRPGRSDGHRRPDRGRTCRGTDRVADRTSRRRRARLAFFSITTGSPASTPYSSMARASSCAAGRSSAAGGCRCSARNE